MKVNQLIKRVSKCCYLLYKCILKPVQKLGWEMLDGKDDHFKNNDSFNKANSIFITLAQNKRCLTFEYLKTNTAAYSGCLPYRRH